MMETLMVSAEASEAAQIRPNRTTRRSMGVTHLAREWTAILPRISGSRQVPHRR
jgi:hypothetical protein